MEKPCWQHRADCIASNRDGSVVASGSDYDVVRLCRADTGYPVRVLEGGTSPVSHVAFSPDGSILGSGSDGRTIRLWDKP